MERAHIALYKSSTNVYCTEFMITGRDEKHIYMYQKRMVIPLMSNLLLFGSPNTKALKLAAAATKSIETLSS